MRLSHIAVKISAGSIPWQEEGKDHLISAHTCLFESHSAIFRFPITSLIVSVNAPGSIRMSHGYIELCGVAACDKTLGHMFFH